MLLKIHTVQGVIFDGEVERVEVPTKLGVIGVLPHHNPLTTIVTPGILKFVPQIKKGSEFLSNTDFLFEDESVALAIGDGFLYTDGSAVILFVASVTTNPQTDETVLQEMKAKLQEQIQQIRSEGNDEEIERAYLHLQKLTADLKLLKIKEKNYQQHRPH